MKATHLPSLTPLRGVAALWVVLFHIDVSTHYRGLGGLFDRVATGFFSKGYLWVDFFFILSGFIMAHVYGQKIGTWAEVKHYLRARLRRLYPLHLFMTGVLVLFSLMVPAIFPSVIDDSWRTYFDWAALPSNLLFTHSMKQHSYLSWNIVSWSIGAEWWTYIVAIPLMRFLASGRSWRLIVLALLAMVGIVLLVHFNPAQNLDITFDYGFFRCLPEFTLGLVLYRLYQKSWGSAWVGKDAVLGTLLLLIALLFHFKINDLYVLPLFALLILGTVYNEGRAKDWLGRPFMIWLGEISYSIYLVHGLWFMVGWFSFPLLGLTSLSAGLKLLYALGFLACTLGMSHYTHAWVEKRWRG